MQPFLTRSTYYPRVNLLSKPIQSLTLTRTTHATMITVTQNVTMIKIIINRGYRYIVTTHFQPHGGRLTFPGFDEPEFKATFKTIIGYKSPYMTVANMPRTEIETRLEHTN